MGDKLIMVRDARKGALLTMRAVMAADSSA